MKYHKITEKYPIVLPAPKTPRSEGLHVSSLIRCIATEVGILTPDTAEELSLSDVRTITDPTAVLRINIGLAWEEHYIPMLGDVVDHPGEMEVEGIYMTHDGESVSVIITPKGPSVQLVCHEVKATYKSTRTVAALENQFMWMAQIKSYCKALNTLYACLHVLFLCGDYSYPIKPLREVWEIEFTQEEIDNNWELLTDYRDHRIKLENEQM